MKKFLFVLMVIFNLCSFVKAQGIAKLYSQFEFAVVQGTVLTRAGNPVVGVKVNIFQARNGEGVFGNINVMENQGNTTYMPKISWGRTNEKGVFTLKGIPTPGSYFIEIKGVKGFKKVQYPLRIDTGSGELIDYFEIYLDKYVKIDSNTKKMLKRMNKLAGQGELSKAGELAKTIIQKEKSLADPYVILGNCSLNNKELNIALSYFNKAMFYGVDNLKIYITASEIAFKLKNLSKSISYLKRGALQGLEKDLKYYNLLFQSYYLSGDKQSAKQTLGEMLETYKNFKNRVQLQKMYNEMK